MEVFPQLHNISLQWDKIECFLKSLWFITTSRISVKTQFQLLMVAHSCNIHSLLLFQLWEARDDRGFSIFPNGCLRPNTKSNYVFCNVIYNSWLSELCQFVIWKKGYNKKIYGRRQSRFFKTRKVMSHSLENRKSSYFVIRHNCVLYIHK